MEENTVDIMENEEVIRIEDPYDIVDVDGPMEDLDEGSETKADSMANVGIAVAGVALVAAAGYGVTKLVKKVWKTKPVKKLRGKLGNALTKGLDEEDEPEIHTVEVEYEATANSDEE